MTKILFVCTGNTCRSPMAEAICRALLTALKEEQHRLLPEGATAFEEIANAEVASAGTMCWFGDAATADACQTLEELYGIDLTTHRSSPLTLDAVVSATHIWTMTEHHIRQILERFPEASKKVQTLAQAAGLDGDIEDPFLCGLKVYQQTAEQIEHLVRRALWRLADPQKLGLDYASFRAYTCAYVLGDDGKYLFLYRNKKKNDVNEGKWIGIGGKVEQGETAEQAALRELREETGLEALEWEESGVFYFASLTQQDFERIHVYRVTRVKGALTDCSEGELGWMTPEEFLAVPHWMGDEAFLEYVFRGERFGEALYLYRGDELLLDLTGPGVVTGEGTEPTAPAEAAEPGTEPPAPEATP